VPSHLLTKITYSIIDIMNNNMNIRKANRKDYKCIDNLYRHNYELYHNNIPNDYKKPPKPTLPEGTFLNMIVDNDSLVLVSETENRITGVLYAEIEKEDGDEWSKPYHRVSIEELSVLPEYHRQGVGTELVKNAESWALEKGIRELIVLVFDFNNDAINFYKNNGFENYSIKMTKKISK